MWNLDQWISERRPQWEKLVVRSWPVGLREEVSLREIDVKSWSMDLREEASMREINGEILVCRSQWRGSNERDCWWNLDQWISERRLYWERLMVKSWSVDLREEALLRETDGEILISGSQRGGFTERDWWWNLDQWISERRLYWGRLMMRSWLVDVSEEGKVTSWLVDQNEEGQVREITGEMCARQDPDEGTSLGEIDGEIFACGSLFGRITAGN